MNGRLVNTMALGLFEEGEGRRAKNNDGGVYDVDNNCSVLV